MKSPAQIRILVVDASVGAMHVSAAAELPALFERGDVLVVNDAATLPASLQAGAIEVRLAGANANGTWTAVLLGEGDWHTRTEDRPAPQRLEVGAALAFDATLSAHVVAVDAESPRLVTLRFSLADDALWAALYRLGRPVQYAHVPAPYALWDVQNTYAGRPWAVEMPSAGRVFTLGMLRALAARGVEVVTITHAAGLSSVGDAAIDARLPLPERYEVPAATWAAIERTHARGGRVIAIGTSVTRALETVARGGELAGVTSLRITPAMERYVVDALFTGVHETTTSHYELLGAFASPPVLAAATREAEAARLEGHEAGDACLVWATPAHVERGDGSHASRDFPNSHTGWGKPDGSWCRDSLRLRTSAQVVHRL